VNSARAVPTARLIAVRPPLFGRAIALRPKARLAWAGVALLCAAVLATGVMLEPDPRGHGTHERLGLPPCSFMLTSGLPCPTCGMTTAFALVLHGHPWDALVAQPAGAGLCVATALLLVLAGHWAAAGRMPWINWDRIGPVRVSLGVGFSILAAWAFKMLHTWVSSRGPGV
jgi:hypothetical protein